MSNFRRHNRAKSIWRELSQEASTLYPTLENSFYPLRKSDYEHLGVRLWFSFNEDICKEDKKKSAKLIAVPEPSWSVPLSIKKVANPHLHCILMLHKDYHNNIVLKKFHETGKKSSGELLVDTWTLCEKTIRKLNGVLPVCSIDIREAYDLDVSGYITKKLGNTSLEQVYKKFSQPYRNLQITKTASPYLTNENISYEDVMWFTQTKDKTDFSKQINTSVTEKNYVEQPVI